MDALYRSFTLLAVAVHASRGCLICSMRVCWVGLGGML